MKTNKREMNPEDFWELFNSGRQAPEIEMPTEPQTAMMGKGLDLLRNRAMKHWQEFCPKMFNQYKQAGILNKKLDEAAEKTYQEMETLEQMGYRPHEAREIVMPKYILLKEEE